MPSPYRKVLLATDFSDNSATASDFVRRLVPEAAFRVVHVAEPAPGLTPPFMRPAERDAFEKSRRQRHSTVQAKLRAFLEARGLPADSGQLVEGSVPREVARVADDMQADLVVVGAHARPSWGGFSLGSRARAIVRASGSDVLVVRGGHEVRAVPDVDRVLAAVDFSESSASATRRADLMAQRLGAELVLFHALNPELWGSHLMLTPDLQGAATPNAWPSQQWLQETAEQMLRRHNEDHVGGRARIRWTQGAPVDEISKAAASEAAGLVVVGASSGGAMERIFFGSVAEGVVEHAPCSVLVVRS